MKDLDYAIKMEKDGEKYYREQAELNKGNSLNSVCLILADEEKKHAQLLVDKKKDKEYSLLESDIVSSSKNIFTDKGDIGPGKEQTMSQLDFYRIASGMEQESIELYKSFSEKATDTKEKELFAYLVRQEKMHLETLEELGRLLSRPNEWVEDAEFGIREDY